jgi:hypothetical protein
LVTASLGTRNSWCSGPSSTWDRLPGNLTPARRSTVGGASESIGWLSARLTRERTRVCFADPLSDHLILENPACDPIL